MKIQLVRVLTLLILVQMMSWGCSKKDNNPINPTTKDTTAVVDYRPIFHFTPTFNWLNDPNGLVYYKGEYHLFFQYNPFGNQWGHMSWGHATSSDLMKWKQQDVAIAEYLTGKTQTGVFSGTAIVDSFNTSGFGTTASPMPLIAIYTANVEGIVQNQCLAYSLDGKIFTRFANNPILDIHSTEFRDPKVFWYSPSHKWVMIISKPDVKKVHFYSSPNLKDWTFMSDFGAIGSVDKVWECPDIFELRVDNTGERKWVLTNSTGHPQQGYLAMQYFIGTFDGMKFTADPLSYPLYVDNGKDFYAGIIYNNLPSADGRKIMMGWANCWEYAGNIPTNYFRGMMSIPRDLHIKKTTNGQYLLTQLPVIETNIYRNTLLFQKDSVSLANTTNNASATKGDALDIELTITKGDAAQAGIKVFKNGNEETVIYYDKSDNTVKMDRTKSGRTIFSTRFASVESVSVPNGNSDIKLRILIDKSLVEVFVNDGEQVMTDQVFPTIANGGIELFSTSGTVVFKNIKIWKMNPSM